MRVLLESATEAGVDVAGLRARLEDARQAGYAFSSGGLDPLIADVAVPVRGAGGHCRAAVSVTGFVQDFDSDAVAHAQQAAADAAGDLEGLLDDSGSAREARVS